MAARVAVEARESRGETPAREERAKLPLDEPGQAFPVPQRGRLRAKRLEAIAHDLVEPRNCLEEGDGTEPGVCCLL